MGAVEIYNGRILVTRRERHDGWTKERRARFLGLLAVTCNVTASCRTMGRDPQGVYQVRRRDAAFAAAWDEALAQGYARLETELLARALIGVTGPDEPDVIPVLTPPPFDPQLALKLLAQRHVNETRGRGGRSRSQPGSREATNASLERKLTALERQMARAGVLNLAAMDVAVDVPIADAPIADGAIVDGVVTDGVVTDGGA